MKRKQLIPLVFFFFYCVTRDVELTGESIEGTNRAAQQVAYFSPGASVAAQKIDGNAPRGGEPSIFPRSRVARVCARTGRIGGAARASPDRPVEAWSPHRAVAFVDGVRVSD